MKYEINDRSYLINGIPVERDFFYFFHMCDFFKASKELMLDNKPENIKVSSGEENILVRKQVAGVVDEIFNEILPPCCDKTQGMKAIVCEKILNLLDREV